MSTASTTAALRVDMHGVTVDYVGPAWERSLSSLLALFGPASREDASALRVRIYGQREPVREPYPSDGARWEPRFFFGVIQGFVRDDGLAYALSDARARAVIDLVDRSITADVQCDERGALSVSTHGLLHASLCLSLRERGLFELHAAAVRDGDSARLVVGHAGAGKTSCALMMLAAGAQYLGDDRVLLRQRAGGDGAKVELCAYPRTFHVPLATASAVEGVLSVAERAEGIGGKLAVDPRRAFPEGFCSAFAGPTTVLLPRVEPRADSATRLVSAAEAMGALIESSALALVDGIRHRDENLALLAALANGGRAYAVALGRDALDRPIETARRILDETRPVR